MKFCPRNRWLQSSKKQRRLSSGVPPLLVEHFFSNNSSMTLTNSQRTKHSGLGRTSVGV